MMELREFRASCFGFRASKGLGNRVWGVRVGSGSLLEGRDFSSMRTKEQEARTLNPGP